MGKGCILAVAGSQVNPYRRRACCVRPWAAAKCLSDRCAIPSVHGSHARRVAHDGAMGGSVVTPL